MDSASEESAEGANTVTSLISNQTPRRTRLALTIAAFAAGTALGGGLALAQGAPMDELTVTGHYSSSGEPRTMARVVSYRDLDLSTDAGAARLERRIHRAAHAVCRQLGEPNTPSGVTPSCDQDAISTAMNQARDAEHNARH
jgi:UrcA family protein